MIRPQCVSLRPTDPVHQEHRDRHHHRRQHARRQDEEEQVLFPLYLEAREPVSGESAHADGEDRRGDGHDQRIHEAARITGPLHLALARAHHLLAAVKHQPLPPRGGGVLFRRRRSAQLRALGEQLDEGRYLRLEDHRRRDGGGEIARLERRRGYPVDRRQEDDRDDQHADDGELVERTLGRGGDSGHASAPSPCSGI